jgi:hypothetical protein
MPRKSAAAVEMELIRPLADAGPTMVELGGDVPQNVRALAAELAAS